MVVGSVVVRGEALAHHPVVGPVMGPGADVAGPEAEPGGRHGLLHRGPIEQHRTVARESAVQLVARALKYDLVSGGQWWAEIRQQQLETSVLLRGKSMQFSSESCRNVEQVK